MMGMRMPETSWAVFRRQVINLRSCCIWLVDSVESMMMHGVANPKKALYSVEMLATNYQWIWHNIPEDFNLQLFLHHHLTSIITHITQIYNSPNVKLDLNTSNKHLLVLCCELILWICSSQIKFRKQLWKWWTVPYLKWTGFSWIP